MAYKKIIPFINGENEIASNIVRMAQEYSLKGADELFIYNYSKIEAEREDFIATMKQVDKSIDIPFFVGMYAGRFEDVKKAFYTGADRVVLKYDILPEEENVLQEAVDRFGSNKIMVEVYEELPFEDMDLPVDTLLLKHVDVGPRLGGKIEKSGKKVVIRDSLLRNDLSDLLKLPRVLGVATNYYEDEEKDIYKVKSSLKKMGIEVNTFESSIDFSEFKLDDNGLIPCIVQDYRTSQVLMMAYMNKESYEATCKTGRMTYWSRSRQELWCKGDTSGHYQYVKELLLDCDNDTILAKVHQVGAACHTGARSCFFKELAKK
ncbi:MAG: phosphoribosyl-AMP cyclohydrolase, partial [Eubacterium sp.]|nr:phosphoribosyl-AMP cyclohydrolase [Eubacterium sp.]